jgi:outer membrane lipoprotein-sorting protein
VAASAPLEPTVDEPSPATAPVASPLATPSPDGALDRIGAARASVKTLVGRFRQSRVIGLLATEVVSRGELTLVRPDRLRWELEPPDTVTYWVGPEGFAMASADGVVRVGKAAAGRFGAVLGDLLVLIGGDLRALRERYEITVSEQAGSTTVVAKPRADTNPEVAKQVSELRMVLGAELWNVERMVIAEKSGDRSDIVVEKLARDVPVAPERMKPPPKR